MAEDAPGPDPARDVIVASFGVFAQAFADRDYDLEAAAERLWHEDALMVPRYARLEGRSFRGPRGAVDFVVEARQLFDRFRPEVEEVVGEGPSRVAIYRIDARVHESEIDIRQRLGAHMEVKDGKIILMRVYGDPRDALKAAGLDDSAA